MSGCAEGEIESDGGDAWRLFLDSALVADLIGQHCNFAAEALNKDRDIFSVSKYRCGGF